MGKDDADRKRKAREDKVLLARDKVPLSLALFTREAHLQENSINKKRIIIST